MIECIYVWAKWFGLNENKKPSQFLKTYSYLKKIGIVFPE